MPLSIDLAHRLAEQLARVRKDGTLDYLRPDGKTQATIQYEGHEVLGVDGVVVSSQHAAGIPMDAMRRGIVEHVIKPVFERYELALPQADRIKVNPTGAFVVGGPHGDAGVTGRKIIVDTYGGVARHGGGAFSGKDPSKVDRSAAYALRWVAKNIVAAGLAERVELQVAYAIGVAHPMSVNLDTFGTGNVPDGQILDAVNEVFDLRPAGIVKDLDLLRPIYADVTCYGHFGRDLPTMTWERTDRAEALARVVKG